MMIAYIDENFPHQLAEGLNTLQQPLNLKEKQNFDVISIGSAFGVGAKDEDWIPKAGKKGAIVLTQDYHIQTTRHQRDLYQIQGLGIFFFKAPSKNGYSYWEMVQQVIRRWERIKLLTRKTNLPFAYRCSNRKDFELLES